MFVTLVKAKQYELWKVRLSQGSAPQHCRMFGTKHKCHCQKKRKEKETTRFSKLAASWRGSRWIERRRRMKVDEGTSKPFLENLDDSANFWDAGLWQALRGSLCGSSCKHISPAVCGFYYDAKGTMHQYGFAALNTNSRWVLGHKYTAACI